jgi:hypothetical protein
MDKHEKAKLRSFLFIENFIVIGVALGFSTQFGVVIYLLTGMGLIGWIMFSTPVFFNHWKIAFIDKVK